MSDVVDLLLGLACIVAVLAFCALWLFASFKLFDHWDEQYRKRYANR